MLTAEEARKATLEARKARLVDGLELIDRCIESAIFNGRFSIEVGGPIKSEILETLRNNGYIVHRLTRLGAGYYLISWYNGEEGD